MTSRVHSGSRIALRHQVLVICTCVMALWLTTDMSASDPLVLTGPRFISRLARQPRLIRPEVFPRTSKPKALCQLSIVFDGTTSMLHELADLSGLISDIGILYRDISGSERIEMAVVVYRDTRSPSGPATVAADFTSDSVNLSKVLSHLKVETGEPYFPEAVDQGLWTALEKLSWNPTDSTTERRILLIGDAPPYANDHSNRVHHDKELRDRISSRQMIVDALLVNSGFTEEEPGIHGTSLKTATIEAPLAREFLGSLTQSCGGRWIDFWDEAGTAKLQDAIVVLPLDSLGKPIPKSEIDAYASPTLASWRIALAHQLDSVRTERPALRAFQRLSESPLVTVPRDPFEYVWQRVDLEAAITDFNEALEEEPNNPVLHLGVANTHALLARLDSIDDHQQAMLRHLLAAQAGLTETTPHPIRAEIEALNAIHVTDQTHTARENFARLTSAEAEVANPGCRLRAAWSMLAIELGFWPASQAADRKPVNEPVVRDLVMQILRHWPDSFEARTLDTILRDSTRSRQVEIPRSWFLAPRIQ